MPEINGPHDALRRGAETRIEKGRQRSGKLPRGDLRSLVHELRVHQIELEMQNETLREAQTAVVLSRDRYAELYDASPVGYLTLGQQGKILEANLEAAVMLGVERADLINDRIPRFLFPDEADRLHLLCRSLVQPAERRTCQLKIVRKDGSSIHVHLHCRLSESSHNGERCFAVALIDMTALNDAENAHRVLEQKLEQTQRLESLGILAGGIAHDFNNLLFGIVTHAGLLAETVGRTSPLQKHIEQIQAAAARSADLCRQMLAYSGKGNFEKCAFDLTDVVVEMGDLMKAAMSPTITFEYDLCRNLPGIEGDMTSIRQIVMNLVVNALEAVGPDSGKVTVSTGLIFAIHEDLTHSWLDDRPDAEEFVFVKVVDTGCGMDEKTTARIFDPFFTTKFPGRGLGLAATLGIIRSHAGGIAVHSQPGHGTVIQVLFPTAKPTGIRQHDPAVSHEFSPQNGTVLIVDDEEIVRESLRAVLASSGYTVRCAADGDAAAEVVRQHANEIALVLMDLTMPGQSIVNTVEHIERMVPNLPVILFSGYSHENDVSRFTNRNIIGFVQKPCDDILSAVQRILRANLTQRCKPSSVTEKAS